jgi:quinol monooxygenase YgiN
MPPETSKRSRASDAYRGGCITYQLYQNEADPTDFAFIEEWTSDEDLAAHFSSDHFKNAAERGAELFAAPPDIRRYTSVA